jgi:hypothetical protein
MYTRLYIFFGGLIGFVMQIQLAYGVMPSVPDSLIKNANAIVLSSTATLDIQSTNKAFYREANEVLVLNQNGSTFSYVSLFYSPIVKIKSFRAEIYDIVGNKIKDIGKNDAKDFSASEGYNIGDGRFKVWNLKMTSYPYVLKYSYEMEYSSLYNLPLWQPVDGFLISVLSASFEVSSPNIELYHKSALNSQTKSSTNIKRWELSNFKALLPITFSANLFTRFPYVATTSSEFDLYGVKGTATSWKDFGASFYKLNEQREDISTLYIPTIDSLASSTLTPRQKVALAYAYLQDNFRYVSIQLGISGWQSQTAIETDRNRYGDCKALVTLMKGILSRIGIPSYMTLVNTNSNRFPLEDNFVHSRFDHVILYVPLAYDTLWLECTSQHSAFNYLGSFTMGREVLVLTEKGGIVKKTPDYTEQHNQLHAYTFFSFDPNTKTLNISTEVEVKDIMQETLREVYNRANKQQLESQIYKLLNLQDAKIENYDFIKIESDASRIILKTTANDKQAVKQIGSRFFISPKLFNPFDELENMTGKRVDPIDVEEGFTIVDTIEVTLPTSYLPENFMIGKEKFIATEFGKCSFNTSFDDKTASLKIMRSAVLHSNTYSSSKAGAFSSFLTEASSIYTTNLVLKKSE